MIENNTRLEIEEIKDMTKKALEGFKTEKTEELENKLRFLTVKNRYVRNLSDYEEKKKNDKKNIKEIEKVKTGAKRIKKI